MEPYTLEQLLDKAYAEIDSKENSTEKIKPKEPIISFVPKKTIINNFEKVALSIRRDMVHIGSALSKELHTDYSLTGDNSLILNAKLEKDRVKNALTRYIKTYVRCHQEKCRSLNTNIVSMNNVIKMLCNKCGSICSTES